MSVVVTWAPNPEPDIASYRLERAPSIDGPWSAVATIPAGNSGADLTYTDATGSNSSYYRIIAIDDEGQESVPSVPFQAVQNVDVAIARAEFVGLDGQPKRATVIISVVGPQTASGGHFLTDGGEPTVVQADANGLLQVALPWGARVRVAVEGMTMVREFTVPSVTTFDLLTAMNDAPDPFTIQTTPALVTRRSF